MASGKVLEVKLNGRDVDGQRLRCNVGSTGRRVRHLYGEGVISAARGIWVIDEGAVRWVQLQTWRQAAADHAEGIRGDAAEYGNRGGIRLVDCSDGQGTGGDRQRRRRIRRSRVRRVRNYNRAGYRRQLC